MNRWRLAIVAAFTTGVATGIALVLPGVSWRTYLALGFALVALVTLIVMADE